MLMKQLGESNDESYLSSRKKYHNFPSRQQIFRVKFTHIFVTKMCEFSDEIKRSFQYITKVLDLMMILGLTSHEHATA